MEASPISGESINIKNNFKLGISTHTGYSLGPGNDSLTCKNIYHTTCSVVCMKSCNGGRFRFFCLKENGDNRQLRGGLRIEPAQPI